MHEIHFRRPRWRSLRRYDVETMEGVFWPKSVYFFYSLSQLLTTAHVTTCGWVDICKFARGFSRLAQTDY